MEYPNSYFEDEVREGFYIPGMVKRSWAVQMDILNQVADICRRHKLSWYADNGTLLGAVRHRGFIPWDDDLDICMLQDDYLRFLKIVQTELPEGYHVLNLDTEPDYEMFLTRITNRNSITMDADYLKSHYGFPYTAGIDIFPLHFLYEDPDREKARRDRAAHIWERIQHLATDRRSEAEICADAEEISGYPVRRDLPLKAALLRLLDRIFRECDGKESTKLALMPYYIRGNDHIYSRTWYEDAIMLPFEGESIRVPAGFDEVLRTEYGNWTAIVKAGSVHGYPFYKDQVKLLKERTGTFPYEYTYQGPSGKDRQDRCGHRLAADGILRRFQEVTDCTCKTALLLEEAGPKREQSDKKNTICELLTACQEKVIDLGNALEAEQGEGCATISLLEDYCEFLFGSYQKAELGETEETESFQEEVGRHLDAIGKSLANNRRRKKEIIFLPVRTTDWKYMEAYYERALSEQAEVHVMPIPYFERDNDGSLGRLHFEYEAFPQELPLTDFRKYDFNSHHPDELVIQNPYDGYESGKSVHPFFYAEHLYQLTDKLTYIPAFAIEDFTDKEEKAVENTRCYVTMPGVAYADRVIVPSERQKEIYIGCLKQATPNADRREWEEKLEVLCPRQTVRKTGTMKNLIFYISFSDYYCGREKTIAWIRDCFRTFAGKRDKIHVLWVEEENLPAELERILPEIYPEYMSLAEEFTEAGLGRRISAAEAVTMLNPEEGNPKEQHTQEENQEEQNFEKQNPKQNSKRNPKQNPKQNPRQVLTDSVEAFYGSGGYLMNLAFRKGIPVMERKRIR